MATLRPSSCRGGFDLDLSGLEESAVDSDDEDVSSVNTEVINEKINVIVIKYNRNVSACTNDSTRDIDNVCKA